MAKHRTYSIEFKRQVAQEFLAGESLHGLSRRHDVSRNLIRVWVAKLEAGTYDEDAEAVRQTQLMLVSDYVHQFHHNLFLRWESSPDLYQDLLGWCRQIGTPTPPDKTEPFGGLVRAYDPQTDETTVEPRQALSSAHPDPTESNVFWMQPLVWTLGDDVRGDDFMPYLRGTAAP